MIILENVSKHYKKQEQLIRALDDVSLSVTEGQLALVQGVSGSGKTTLINCIAGLTRPTSGKLVVAGQSVGDLSGREATALRADTVALVFQLFHLVPYLNALENVLLPTLAAPLDNAEVRAKELLDQLGLAERMKHFPSELSAGERQRCAMARAVLHRPKVILADEPTGNLDEESAGHVIKLLETCRSEGATILLVSHHHFDQIRPDLVFPLRDGKLTVEAAV